MGKEVISLKVYIKSGCNGCGRCASACPEVFALDKSGLGYVHGLLIEETEDAVQLAIQRCGAQVIGIEKAPGGVPDIVWPRSG